MKLKMNTRQCVKQSTGIRYYESKKAPSTPAKEWFRPQEVPGIPFLETMKNLAFDGDWLFDVKEL